MEAKFTVTEALAELKVIDKRLATKQSNVLMMATLDDRLKDPNASDGGTPEVVSRELQAISDLRQRRTEIRKAIAQSNRETYLEVEDITKTIEEWLFWRREDYPHRVAFLKHLKKQIDSVRQQVRSAVPDKDQEEAMRHLQANADEAWLTAEVERLETVEGKLDGKLSLLNATTFVTV